MITRIAFRNVFRNRRRSAITLLVIVFGAIGLILFGGYKQQTFRGLRESTIRSRIKTGLRRLASTLGDMLEDGGRLTTDGACCAERACSAP